MRKEWKKLARMVSSFGGVKVIVAGDLVLDRFWFGTVQRISREAPVPIVKLARSALAPGCAANSASNLASLGAVPVVFGIVGRDREGTDLLGILEKKGADTRFVLRQKSWITPTKTRILAGSVHGPKQQLVRVDSGEHEEWTGEITEKASELVSRAAREASSAIISDYGYGLAERIDLAAALGRAENIAVDSRFALTGFRGATTATPNEEEFERAIEKPVPASRKTFEREADRLRERLGLEALLVTRGSKGMALSLKDSPCVHIGIAGKDEVVDVTGAGDTVIAAYVLSLAVGASYEEAANIANVAGGIVVQKPGTATVSREELSRSLELWGKGLI